MNRKHMRWMLLPSLLLCVTGCQATCTAGRKIGQAAFAVPSLVAEGIIRGIFESDETISERDRRERQERQWKQYWREHPNENPAMHDAFKDDYE
jgi:hypothetical protein